MLTFAPPRKVFIRFHELTRAHFCPGRRTSDKAAVSSLDDAKRLWTSRRRRTSRHTGLTAVVALPGWENPQFDRIGRIDPGPRIVAKKSWLGREVQRRRQRLRGTVPTNRIGQKVEVPVPQDGAEDLWIGRL